jgi:transcriptional regulator with XRE-family HTH domain
VTIFSVEPLATKTKRKRIAGSQLSAARNASGLSQEELAALLDVRVATISVRENAADVSLETWIAWSSVLGLPLDWKPGDAVPKKKTAH